MITSGATNREGDTMSDRERFETYVADKHPEITEGMTNVLWLVWQAAQATPVEPQKLETQEPLKLIAPIAYELRIDGVDFSRDFINGADGIYRSRNMAVNRADAIRSARGEDWKNNITIHPVYSTPPADMVSVPREPTPDTIDAMRDAYNGAHALDFYESDGYTERNKFIAAYKAVIAGSAK